MEGFSSVMMWLGLICNVKWLRMGVFVKVKEIFCRVIGVSVCIIVFFFGIVRLVWWLIFDGVCLSGIVLGELIYCDFFWDLVLVIIVR